MSLTLASRLTIGRILAVPFFISTVLYYSPQKDYLRYAALGIFLVAVILDLLDGYAARKFHQETAAGAVLDPLADKVLLISAYICLYKVGIMFSALRFPIWLVVAVISRDVVLLVGAMTIRIVTGGISVKPTRWGKMAVFFEILAVCGMLLQWRVSMVLWSVIFILVVISTVDYMVKGVRELNGTEATWR